MTTPNPTTEHQLPPAPWRVERYKASDTWFIADANGGGITGLDEFRGDAGRALAERIVLWRNAEAILERRGWYPVNAGCGKWLICTNGGAQGLLPATWREWTAVSRGAEPLALMVASDHWWTANVDAKQH